MKKHRHHNLFAIIRTILLIGFCYLLTSCNGDRIGGTLLDASARVADRVEAGVGITKSTDGWWYVGGKIRGKRGKGSDAEESEPEWETPLVIPHSEK